MKTKHKNIPVFIPHLGCPNMCVFCNQRSISGRQSFDRAAVERDIDEALETIAQDAEVEIAYFGGSFTGIDRELMIYLLDLAGRYVNEPKTDRARVTGIRFSTRPDYINGEIMEILFRYPIKTVELGLQSMDDEVLRLSNRGHTARDAENACRLIKEQGYDLIGQMMIGLPGGSLQNELETARKICDMGANGARIYPTVTFFGTELANMAERGEYEMLSDSDAVMRAKEVYKVFSRRGVDVIRIGLSSSDNLCDPEKVKGGANHPALGELVIGEVYFDDMCEQIERTGIVQNKILTFSVPRGEVSRAVGQKGINRERIVARYGAKKVVIKEDIVNKLTLKVSE
ncbi:MAG: radical SAM protein [Clostridia bacterium]|nr:radical SAM protein [Clostridia bacterium]